MFRPRLVANNDKPAEPPADRKYDAIIRRAIMLDSAPGSTFGDIDNVKFDDIPANWPPFEK